MGKTKGMAGQGEVRSIAVIYDCTVAMISKHAFIPLTPLGMHRKISIETTEKRNGIGIAMIDSLDLVSSFLFLTVQLIY